MSAKLRELEASGLAQFAVGTVFQWVAASRARRKDFREGKFYLVTKQRAGFASPHLPNAVCEAVLCRRNGRPFKERHHPYAHALAEWLTCGSVRIIPPGALP